MKIFGWTTGSPGLDRIRVSLPLEEIAKHGHEVHFDNIFKRENGDADTLIGCRVALPDPSRLWTHASGMYGGPFCVFETDDDNLNISKYNPIPFEFWARPEVRFHYVANARVAHRIVTSTPYLQNLLYDQIGHPDIVVAPNSVPGWMLNIPRKDHPGRTPLIVGWAGGESHTGDWEWARSGIRRAILLAPGTVLRFVGMDFRRRMNLPNERMQHQHWFETVDDYWKRGLYFDIGLAPLRPEPFNRAKSTIKLIEYAARGIPVVAQDYGPYTDFVRDGETGYLVKTTAEWTEAIVTLAKNPDLRDRMGQAAREQAREHTIERLWLRYLEAYTP